jgi:predicted RNA-binding Zn-ribbon protein involved in translation (DUF1610 family)
VRSRKPPDWLIEERRNALGHWSAFCPSCGFAQRYFQELEHELPTACPHCGGTFVSRCPSCNARFASAFAVDCESCGKALRAAELYGTQIRRSSD